MLRSARRPGLLLLLLAAVTLGACNPTPSITILTPAHGAFTTASTVTITGRVNNAKPGLDVRVNGQSVPVNPDDTWSVTLPLDPVAIINPVTATLVRLSDGVLLSRQRIVVHAADSVADGDFSASGVGLRLNDSGLDQIEPILESQIDLDLAVLLPVGTVLINNQCMGTFLGLCTGRATVTVVNPPPGISGFAIDVDSQTHQVRGDIDVFDIRADVYISGTGIVPSCSLRISANSTQILGDYTLQPLASDPTSVDVNLVGSPDISFSGFDQEYTSGICDVPLIGDLIQLIIGNVQPLVLDGLVGFLSDPDGAGPSDSPLAEAFEVALGDISIAGPVGEALQVNLEAPLFDVLEDPAGITLGSDVRVTSSVGTEPGQCQPPAGVPDLAASFHVDEPFPTFGSTTPVGGLPFHLGLAISTSAFNQLLKAQIECGLLQIELTELDIGFGPTPLTAGFLAIIIPEFGSLADPGLPLRLVLEPTLAPFLTGENGPSGEIGEIRVGHYLLEVRTLPSPTGSGLFLRGAIDFRAGLTMTFDNLTGQLQVGIGSVAPQDITVGILDNPINTNETSLSMALPFLIAPVLPSLGDNLGAFPIPGFFGLALEGVEVSRSGPFFSLFADLVPAP